MTTCYVVCDFATLDIDEYFKGYHYYDVYDSNIEYNYREYKMNYGKGEHTYILCKYVLSNKDGETKHYIVAKEYPTEEELNKLAKYCTCEYHMSNFFGKRTICACCVGCIGTGRGRGKQEYIDEARRRLENNVKINNSCIIF
jgi:hypothetical protein